MRGFLPVMLLAVILTAGQGCVAIPAGVGAAAGWAVRAGEFVLDVAPVVAKVRAAIKAQADPRAKLLTFRDRFCSSAELRGQGRKELTRMMVDGGVAEPDAAFYAALAKKLGARLCGGDLSMMPGAIPRGAEGIARRAGTKTRPVPFWSLGRLAAGRGG